MGQAKQQEVKWQWLGLNVGCQRHTLVLLLSGFLQQPPVQITEDELLASNKISSNNGKKKRDCKPAMAGEKCFVKPKWLYLCKPRWLNYSALLTSCLPSPGGQLLCHVPAKPKTQHRLFGE